MRNLADPTDLVRSLLALPPVSKPSGLLAAWWRDVGSQRLTGIAARCLCRARGALPPAPIQFIGGFDFNIRHQGSEEIINLAETTRVSNTDLHRLALANCSINGLQVATADSDFVSSESDHTTRFVSGELNAEQKRIRQCYPLAMGMHPQTDGWHLLRDKAAGVADRECLTAWSLGFGITHNFMRTP